MTITLILADNAAFLAALTFAGKWAVCWLDWTCLLTSFIWIGSVSFLPSRRKELQLCRLMQASQTVGLGSLRRGEALLTSAPSHGRRGRAAWSRPFVTIKEMDGAPGAAWTEQPERTLDFSPGPSRVRRLPVARALSGSNRILKGLLTRNSGIKKYAAPVAPASVFHGWFCMFRVLTDYRD